MTQAEFARHRGVSKPAVTAWKKRGLLVLAEDPKSGRPLVDVARTDARLNANIDPGRGRPPGSEASAASVTAAPELPDQSPGQASLPIAPGAETPPAGDSLQALRMEQIRHQTDGQKLKNARDAGQLVAIDELQRRASEVGRAARERMQAWFFSVAERLAATSDVRTLMTIGEEGIDQVFAELAAAAERGAFSGDGDEAGDEDLPEVDPEEAAAPEADSSGRPSSPTDAAA